MINSLQGKSAGMMITPNSTGAGGSSKILFRGNKSISGNNQPLVVVDGVPVMMNITNSQVDGNCGGQRDWSGILNLHKAQMSLGYLLKVHFLLHLGSCARSTWLQR